MNEEGLTTIIHRDRHGTVKKTRKLSVPLTNELGYSETLAMSQKGVTDNLGVLVDAIDTQATAIEEMQRTIDNIIAGNASASLSASPAVVFKGASTNVVLTAKCNPVADSIVIMKGDTVIQQGTDVATLQATVSVNTNSTETYKAVFMVSNGTREVTASVTAVSPIFYGVGDDETDAQTMFNAQKTPAGTYTINVQTTGSRIYFVIPDGMTIKSAVENGITQFPLAGPTNTTREVAGSTVNYKVYKSNELEAGTYKITLT